jgi:glucose/mannose-6-phosphate isomerase
MVGAGALLLESFGIVDDARAALQAAGRELARLRALFRAEVPRSRNVAKSLALGLQGKLPVIYSLQRMSSVARRAKNQFAENSKLYAKYDLLPESGHNEIVAWQNRDARMAPVLLRDSVESRGERAVLEAFKESLVRTGRKPLEVRVNAVSDLGRFLGPIFCFDYVSVYLACLMGVDPTPTEGIRHYRRFFSLMKGR